MKKNVLKLCGLTVCLLTFFLNLRSNLDAKTTDIKLSDLAIATDANAECVSSIESCKNTDCCSLGGSCRCENELFSDEKRRYFGLDALRPQITYWF